MMDNYQNISIEWINLIETGRYNQMYSRPFKTQIDGTTLNILTDSINSCNKIATPAAISGIASSIVSPSAVPVGQHNIANGWGERRIRFTMCVKYSTAIGPAGYYFFQGYTNYPGVSMNGSVDPNMEFVINSFITTTRVTMVTPMGTQYVDNICDNVQLFTGADGNIYSQSDNNSIFSATNPVYGMRPIDISCGIHSEYISLGAKQIGESVIDGRVRFHNKAQRAKRKHSIPSNYLSDIISAQMNSSTILGFGQGQQDMLENIAGALKEEEVGKNIFIQHLARLKNNYITNKFTWRDLQMMDNTIDSRARFVAIGQAMKTSQSMPAIHDVGMTESWNGYNRETQLASMLSSSIPALMIENFITSIKFRSTNMDTGGQPNTLIYDIKSITNMDMSRFMNAFIHRFNTEIVPDISLAGHQSYMVDIRSDIYGETWIGIALDSSSIIEYAAPSFCDAIYSPMKTFDENVYTNVVHDLNHVMSYVSEEVLNTHGTSSIMNNSIIDI